MVRYAIKALVVHATAPRAARIPRNLFALYQYSKKTSVGVPMTLHAATVKSAVSRLVLKVVIHSVTLKVVMLSVWALVSPLKNRTIDIGASVLNITLGFGVMDVLGVYWIVRV